MVEARWNGSIIASSDDTVVVEGNHYFPAGAVDPAVLRPSSTTTVCPWKGTAHYYSLHVDGADNRDECERPSMQGRINNPPVKSPIGEQAVKHQERNKHPREPVEVCTPQSRHTNG